MKNYLKVFYAVFTALVLIYVAPSYYKGVTKKIAQEIKKGDIILLDYWGVEADGLYKFEVIAIMDGKIYYKKIEFLTGWLGTPEGNTKFDSYNTVRKVPVVWDIKKILIPINPFLLGFMVGLFIFSFTIRREHRYKN